MQWDLNSGPVRGGSTRQGADASGHPHRAALLGDFGGHCCHLFEAQPLSCCCSSDLQYNIADTNTKVRQTLMFTTTHYQSQCVKRLCSSNGSQGSGGSSKNTSSNDNAAFELGIGACIQPCAWGLQHCNRLKTSLRLNDDQSRLSLGDTTHSPR